MNSPAHEDEVTTVDLGTTPPAENEPVPAVDTPAPSDSVVGDDSQLDWVGDGLELYLEADPENPYTVELHTLSRVRQETGLVVTGLNPVALRALHAQIGAVIEDQRYAEWVASGNRPDDFEDASVVNPEDSSDLVEEDADDAEQRSRFQRAVDPAGMSRMVEKLGGDSPVKGLDWRSLVFLGFMIAAVLLVIVSRLT